MIVWIPPFPVVALADPIKYPTAPPLVVDGAVSTINTDETQSNQLVEESVIAVPKFKSAMITVLVPSVADTCSLVNVGDVPAPL